MHLVVKRRIDAVAGQDREADLLQRRRELLGEARLVPRVAVQERREIERRDLDILVELVALMLGQAIGVRLPDLVVFLELAVERLGRSVMMQHPAAAVAPSRRMLALALDRGARPSRPRHRARPR